MKLPDRDLEYADTPITKLEHNVGKQLRYGCRRWTRTHTRLRSPDFLSPPCSRTSAGTRRQGATKQRFYRGSALLNGQGGTGRHPFAVRLRSKRGHSKQPARLL